MHRRFIKSIAAAPSALPVTPPSIEQELIRSLRQGETKAFSRLYDSYAPALYQIVLKIVKEEQLAQDVLQEAFVRIFHHFPDYDPGKGRLFTWLLNVTRNLAIDQIRSLAFRQRSLTHSFDMGKEYPLCLQTHQAELTGLQDLLLPLRAEEKILLELVFYQGYSGPEVARQLDIPLGTVKTRLRTAMGKLRHSLNREEGWVAKDG